MQERRRTVPSKQDPQIRQQQGHDRTFMVLPERGHGTRYLETEGGGSRGPSLHLVIAEDPEDPIGLIMRSGARRVMRVSLLFES